MNISKQLFLLFVKQTTWFTKGLRPAAVPAEHCPTFRAKQTTWFTKGLRLQGISSRLDRPSQWNKRPDLRRDCDSIFAHVVRNISDNETNDLIYEGIATGSGLNILLQKCMKKQTTWFTKGLRRLWWFRFLSGVEETNDLIYEGIATLWFLGD